METQPHVADAAVRFLCTRLREADQQLEAIALYPIEGRLARFFLAAARAKVPGCEEGRVTIDLPISQSELALLIGRRSTRRCRCSRTAARWSAAARVSPATSRSCRR